MLQSNSISLNKIQRDSIPSASLVPYAVTEANSLGREHVEPAPTNRGEFQRDRDRIIHSTAFRRLEYKTQVFVNHEGDLYRTRLTHSLEVAQIARSIARSLALNEDLAETIALAHDLGHTPFGHAGQDALNACMREYGGFEHNMQSLRVVEKLEHKYPNFEGLNLMFESREGILKHCSVETAKKLGPLGQRFLRGQQPSLEAQLTNLADEIAYNNHDIDDGIRANMLDVVQLKQVEIFNTYYEKARHSYPQLNERRIICEVVRNIINALVTDLIQTSSKNIKERQPKKIDDIRECKHRLIAFSDEILRQHHQLKKFLNRNLYQHYQVHRMSTKAKQIITELFRAFLDDPMLLPNEHSDLAQQTKKNKGTTGAARVISDYIAGMTDRYAIAEHKRLFHMGDD